MLQLLLGGPGKAHVTTAMVRAVSCCQYYSRLPPLLQLCLLLSHHPSLPASPPTSCQAEHLELTVLEGLSWRLGPFFNLEGDGPH